MLERILRGFSIIGSVLEAIGISPWIWNNPAILRHSEPTNIIIQTYIAITHHHHHCSYIITLWHYGWHCLLVLCLLYYSASQCRQHNNNFNYRYVTAALFQILAPSWLMIGNSDSDKSLLFPLLTCLYFDLFSPVCFMFSNLELLWTLFLW